MNRPQRIQARAFQTGPGHDQTGRRREALSGLEEGAGTAKIALLDLPTRIWMSGQVCVFVFGGGAGRRGGRDGQALLSNGSAPLQSPNNTGVRQVSRPRLGAGCSAV